MWWAHQAVQRARGVACLSSGRLRGPQPKLAPIAQTDRTVDFQLSPACPGWSVRFQISGSSGMQLSDAIRTGTCQFERLAVSKPGCASPGAATKPGRDGAVPPSQAWACRGHNAPNWSDEGQRPRSPGLLHGVQRPIARSAVRANGRPNGEPLIYRVASWLATDPESEPPPDFNLRHGVSFGVSRKSDLKGAYYTDPPKFIFCATAGGDWDVTFTWLLSSKGAMPPGIVELTIPRDATNIRAEAIPFTVNNTGRELRLDKPIDPPEVATFADHKLVRYSPKAGPFIWGGGIAVAGTEIRFDLPSTRIRRHGLGEWDFRIPYSGRLGSGAEKIPATVGSARFEKRPSTSPYNRDSVELVLCTHSSFGLRYSHPDSSDSGINSYSWTTPITEELVIEGRMYGGLLYMFRQAAPEVLIGVVWAILGVIYGMAMQPNKASPNPRRKERPASLNTPNSSTPCDTEKAHSKPARPRARRRGRRPS